MSSADETLEQMGNNPHADWRIEDLVAIAARYGVMVRQGKGSHVFFGHDSWDEALVVPAKKPIKPVYIRRFVALIGSLPETQGGE